MAQNNSQMENLHAFLVRSYTQHMNDSMSVITQSLNTIRRQDAAFSQMIRDTYTMLNTERGNNLNTNRNENIHNNPINNGNIRSRRPSTLYEPNILRSTDPYRHYYSTTTRRNTSRNFYNNIRNVWSQMNQNYTNGLTFDDFEDVVITPTNDEINNATHIIRYGNITQPQNQTCPISLSTFDDDTDVMRIRYCGHLFSPRELQTWFQQNVRCPLCRYDIRNYAHNLPSSDVARTTTPTNQINDLEDSDDEIINETNNEQDMIHTDISNNILQTISNDTIHTDDMNRTNITHNRDGSMVYTRNIMTTNINDLQNELQNLFSDINSSVFQYNENNSHPYSISNDISNNPNNNNHTNIND